MPVVWTDPEGMVQLTYGVGDLVGQSQFADYLAGRLGARGVVLEQEAFRALLEFINVGMQTAEHEAPPHWELAFRGAFEVLLDEVVAQFQTYDRRPIVSHVTVRAPEITFMQMTGMARSGQAGSDESQIARAISAICPLWPFCGVPT